MPSPDLTPALRTPPRRAFAPGFGPGRFLSAPANSLRPSEAPNGRDSNAGATLKRRFKLGAQSLIPLSHPVGVLAVACNTVRAPTPPALGSSPRVEARCGRVPT